MASIPNEYLQPNWSAHHVKLLIDLDTFSAGEVEYNETQAHTHTPVARSLFYVHPDFIKQLSAGEAEKLTRSGPMPIGHRLTPSFFNIYDTNAVLDEHGLPEERLLPYMKDIVGARHSPPSLKASIVNTILEHNRLTEAVRDVEYKDYSFASFSGVFIDIYDQESDNYLNLFQPVALTIKPEGRMQEIELLPEEIHSRFDRLEPVEPRLPLNRLIGDISPDRIVSLFTYRPGFFQNDLDGQVPFDEGNERDSDPCCCQ